MNDLKRMIPLKRIVPPTGTNNRRGLSLLEGLISLLILLIGMGGMAIAYQRHIYQTVSARSNGQAAMIAHSVLSEIEANDDDNVDLTYINENFCFTFAGERVACDDSTAFFTPVVTMDQATGWKNVSIGITWNGWEDENEKGGFNNQSTDFAYLLEAIISPRYGTRQDDGG